MFRFSEDQMRDFRTIEFHNYRRGLIARLTPLEPEYGRDATEAADAALAFCAEVGLKGRDVILGCAILMMADGREGAMSAPSLAPVRDPARSEGNRKTVIHQHLAHLETARRTPHVSD